MSLIPVSGKGLARLFDKAVPKYFTAQEMAMILSEDLRQKEYDLYFLCLFLWNTGREYPRPSPQRWRTST